MLRCSPPAINWARRRKKQKARLRVGPLDERLGGTQTIARWCAQVKVRNRIPLLGASYERQMTVSGAAYWVLVRGDVLRIPDFVLDCAIYLYGSVEEARRGHHSGASGFLVGVPSEVFPTGHYFTYAVTNRHVIDKGASVVRLNVVGGDVDVVDLKPTDWSSHPSQDLAAAPIQISQAHHKMQFVTPEMFLSKGAMKEWDVGPGDDTFIVGRFVYADGGIINQASARFGKISMNPGQPVKQASGHLQESFLVESHSIGGYSGSPVFVYFHPMSLREMHPDTNKEEPLAYLLGVDWGHLPSQRIPVTKRNRLEEGSGFVEEETDFGVQLNSGIMGVVPAWHVMDLLNLEELKDKRIAGDRHLAEERGGSGVEDLTRPANPPVPKLAP